MTPSDFVSMPATPELYKIKPSDLLASPLAMLRVCTLRNIVLRLPVREAVQQHAAPAFDLTLL